MVQYVSDGDAVTVSSGSDISSLSVVMSPIPIPVITVPWFVLAWCAACLGRWHHSVGDMPPFEVVPISHI